MDFKDRSREMRELKALLSSNKFEFLVLYGRRRIGKTELVLNATKNMKRVYYLATGEKNLDRFYEVCIQQDQRVSSLRKDFEVLLDHLKDNVEVVIIDEFQNMITEDNNILHLLQSAIDTKLKESKLKLIVLGSSVSIIGSKVLSYKSPVYGRRTASLKLKPVSFFDLHEFFPDSSAEELLEIYGFADGIPQYLVKIEDSFWHWLDRELKEEKSFIRDEVDFLMKYEFENPSTYKLILEAIANGKSKMNEIKDFVRVSRTDLSPYLRNLLDVDLIRREVPATENQKSRNGRYYLKDNFLRFWFKFVYPNLSAIEMGAFRASTIGSRYPEHLGRVFEDVSRDYLAKSGSFVFSRIGSWWRGEDEIDIVAIDDEENSILFGECKWKDGVDAERVAGDLLAKSEKVEWRNGKRSEKLAVFAKSFSRRITSLEGRPVLCADLTEMLKMRIAVNTKTFEEITKPLKEEAKRVGLKESDVVDIVHRFRSKQRKQS